VNKGFLAIWCEISQESLKDYRDWITKEHIADRTVLPGWLGARFCIDTENERSHFFLYATEGKHVFSERPYLDVLNNPSPWTNRIMPKFGPFDRALGEQMFKLGNGYGAYMTVSRVKHSGPLDVSNVGGELSEFLRLPQIVSVRLMKLDRSSTDIKSQEKTMRQGVEGDFDYLLVIEALSEQAALAAKAAAPTLIRKTFPANENFDLSTRKVIYGETSFELEQPF